MPKSTGNTPANYQTQAAQPQPSMSIGDRIRAMRPGAGGLFGSMRNALQTKVGPAPAAPMAQSHPQPQGMSDRLRMMASLQKGRGPVTQNRGGMC